MTSNSIQASDLDRHLRKMRLTTGLFLASVPVALALSFVLPHRSATAASPMAITLAATAASLWLGFSANRDAGGRLDSIRRAFAFHAEEERLLRDYWLVYLVVLVRLEVIVLCGLVVAVWGVGPGVGAWIVLLGGLMVALTWPTARKTQLLLGRARALLDEASN